MPSNPSTSAQLYAAGLNAHRQVQDKDADEVRLFTPLPLPEPIATPSLRILRASWSSLALLSDQDIQSQGFQNFTCGLPSPTAQLKNGFGDQDGLIGCLDTEGKMYLLTTTSSGERTAPLTCASKSSSPPIADLALAGNGRVAVTFVQAPNARLTHVAEFATLADFLAWHADPAGKAKYPTEHHMLPGQTRQLLANTATFVLLMEGGEVYTWGDPRLRTLGRSIGGEGGGEADKAGVVEALGGLKIVKVACGGWLIAALDEGGAVYLFGAVGAPGKEGRIKCLKDAGAGEVALVELLGSENGEPLDVLDVGVGDGHVVLAAEGGRVFVVGDNSNGQLGLGSSEVFLEEWTEIPAIQSACSVVCGPKSSFIFTS